MPVIHKKTSVFSDELQFPSWFNPSNTHDSGFILPFGYVGQYRLCFTVMIIKEKLNWARAVFFYWRLQMAVEHMTGIRCGGPGRMQF